MTRAIGLLLTLGLCTQIAAEVVLRHDLAALRRGEGGGVAPIPLLLSFAPILLAAGGALAGHVTRRRAPRWSWLVLGIALAILTLGWGVAAYLAIEPLPLLGGSRGLSL